MRDPWVLITGEEAMGIEVKKSVSISDPSI